MESIKFQVPSISCSACASKVKGGILEIRGINDVEVDLKTQMVEVEYNPSEVQPKDIKAKVQNLGFEVV